MYRTRAIRTQTIIIRSDRCHNICIGTICTEHVGYQIQAVPQSLTCPAAGTALSRLSSNSPERVNCTPLSAWSHPAVDPTYGGANNASTEGDGEMQPATFW